MRSIQLKVGFNLIGKVYNPIKRIVLGDLPEQVISRAVSYLRPSGNILVVGGGGDNTVLELLNHPSVKKVTLIDISTVLLDEANQRLMGHPRFSDVKTYAAPFLEYSFDRKYDCIVCPFYLDLFSNKEVRKNITRFNDLLTDHGEVVLIDFSSRAETTGRRKVFVAFLYMIFLGITGVFRFRIPPYKKLFGEQGFTLVYDELWKGWYQIQSFRK